MKVGLFLPLVTIKKNSKVEFYLDHLGSSAQLQINNLRSGRLGYVTQMQYLGGGIPTLSVRVMSRELEVGGEQPSQVKVLTTGVRLRSIIYM